MPVKDAVYQFLPTGSALLLNSRDFYYHLLKQQQDEMEAAVLFFLAFPVRQQDPPQQ